MRSGIIAKKVGMTRLFMDDGKQVPVTVLQPVSYTHLTLPTSVIV